MALALESSSQVERRTKYALAKSGPTAQAVFKVFFKEWAANFGNADLQFVPYDGLDAEGANGYNSGIAAACTIRAFYGRKTATTEDVFMALLDDATGAEGTTFLASIGFFGQNGTSTTLPRDEAFAIFTTGLPVAAGVNVKAYTTVSGTTDSTAGAAPSGFFIVSA